MKSLTAKPEPPPGLILVIPCHDEPDLLTTLASLVACEKPGCLVQVRVVINASLKASEEVKARNQQTLLAAQQWVDAHPREDLRFLFENHDDLPPKHAGVGLARKIGMDAAAHHYQDVGYPQGPILCLDADCTVATNYLRCLKDHFHHHPKTPGCSIHYEHPLKGLAPAHRLGIAAYELYLRYYRQGLVLAGHPSAFHTVGSSMAVRADVYLRQGGMNRRKAGEDFYFLQKIMALGGFTQVTNTTVFPSPRRSLRVPFGTGRAMEEWLAAEATTRMSYDPQVFRDLRDFFRLSPRLYRDSIEPDSLALRQFLAQAGLEPALQRIRANTTSQESFQKKFFHWFNLFLILKYIHWATDHHYPKIPLEEGVSSLWGWMGQPQPEEPGGDVEGWLATFRRFEVGQGVNVSR
ncbi:MAG: family 2 glycosyl transferase [Magnetococcales bacterium]|nr:family 2 glycosyl transferase [Magnetococcales bacterium]